MKLSKLSGSIPQLSVLALSVALTTIASAAFAAVDQKLLDAATKLLAAGNPKQAYVDLLAQQDAQSGNPEYDYLLGVAALDSGKIDDAIIAFERVLAINPKNAGAQLDLARAYYTAGSMDLAESTFRALKDSNPPAPALATINKYLDAIKSKKDETSSRFGGYAEGGLGYDSNITGVPADFTNAVASAFNITGILPTGNSVKRKAAFVGAAGGIDYTKSIAQQFVLFGGVEARGRAYQKQTDFNSLYGEAKLGAGWSASNHQLRLTTNISRFNQDGLAPGSPKPTNERKSAGGALDYRFAMSEQTQWSLGTQYQQTRFPSTNIEDINSVILSGNVVHSLGGKGAPVIYLSAFTSKDKAVRKLADNITDKSKQVSGVRGYLQYSVSQPVVVFGTVGYTQRRDDKAFARATQVAKGEDKLTDAALGVVWRFRESCVWRTQLAYSKNNSNIAIYSYSRNEISSNVRCEL